MDNHHDNRSAAIYWDFENLHAGVLEAKYGEGAYTRQDIRFKPQEPLVDVQALVELAASHGPIAINRAYGNWQFFSRYRDALLQASVELIQLFPPGASAKNGADIKLCLDAAEDIGRFGHIGTVIIIGGDSDFMPVAQKIKAAGRTLIGIGTRPNTNRHWAKSCHEFRFYENLVAPGAPQAAPLSDTSEVAPATPADAATDLLRRAVRLLAGSTGDIWVDKDKVLPMMKRLDPTFDPKDHGYTGFGELLLAARELLDVNEGDAGQRLRLR